MARLAGAKGVIVRALQGNMGSGETGSNRDVRSETPTPKICILAGEVSGDQRAASVVAAIRTMVPDAEIRGMGGPLLRAAGMETVVDFEKGAGGVMGVTEVFGALPQIFRAFREIKRLLVEWRPDVVVLVDYPGFNLRVAKFARRLRVPVVYYIPPKVWAWRKSRIALLDRFVNRVVAILPFEKEFHRRYGFGRTTFVGHPFVDDLHYREPPDREQEKLRFCGEHGLDPARPLLAVLPGSRTGEIKRHLPILIAGLKRLCAQGSEFTAVVTVPSQLSDEVTKCLAKVLAVGRKQGGLKPDSEVSDVVPDECIVPDIKLLPVDSLSLMRAADVGLLKCGTCNLEAAFLGLPMVIVYRLAPLSALVAQLVVKIKSFSLVNIVCPRLAPELIQDRLTPEAVAATLKPLLESPVIRNHQRVKQRDMRKALAEYDDITAISNTEAAGALRSAVVSESAAARCAQLVLATARGNDEFRPTLSRVLSYLQPYRLLFVTGLLAMVVFGATDGAVPFVAKYALDHVLSGENANELYLFPVLLIAISLVRAAGDFFQQYLNAKVGHLIIRDLRDSIARKVLRLHTGFYVHQASGDVLSRVTSDVLLLRSLLTDSVSAVVRDSIRIAALAIAAVIMDPVLALIAVTGFPLAVFPIYRFGRKMRELSKRGQDAIGAVSSLLQEVMMGNRVVKIFAGEEFEEERFRIANDRLTKTFIRSERIRALTGPVSEIFASVAIALVIIYGGASVLSHERTQGQFIGFLLSVFLLYDPFKKLSRVSASVQQGLAGAQRIFEILDIPEAIQEPKSPRSLSARSSIEFDHVSFVYNTKSERKVLDDICLKVEEGERVALVGLSGSGKSTLVDLIPRFIDPTGGEVRVGGVPIRDVSLAELRSRITMVGQHTFLFNDTVAANIAYGNRGATRREIESAAEQACALEFVERLPNGFATVIGEGGSSLSGGERQRIAIARAILKGAPILLLDEATASLDNRSEREVQRALEALERNRTTLVVAHRLSTVVNANVIIVMHDGKIVERGSHAELLALEGEYFRLHSMALS